jgi:putative tryptophan/tyrosine transport system substrate-binding protein
MSPRGRRTFLIASGAMLVAPSLALAQQNTRTTENPARVGMLWSASKKATVHFRKAAFEGLAALGWVEGKNLIVDARYTDGKQELHGQLAKELIALAPDVLLTPNMLGAVAAHKLTTTIPIVFVFGWDTIGKGLAQSLARPGGNVTGLLSVNDGINSTGKRLSLLREAIPSSQRIALLQDPSSNPTAAQRRARDLEPAAKTMGIALEGIEISSPDTFDAAFSALERMRPDAVLVLATPRIFEHRREIVRRINAARFAAMYDGPPFVAAGGLMSYSPSWVDLFRRSADYVDRILRGAKPGDLPIQQPTLYELIVNLKTAKAIGLTIPQSFMLRVDRVIE